MQIYLEGKKYIKCVLVHTINIYIHFICHFHTDQKEQRTKETVNN